MQDERLLPVASGALAAVLVRIEPAIAAREAPFPLLQANRQGRRRRPHNNEAARRPLEGVLDPSSLRPALAGVHTAYYLVHSLGSKGDHERQDREAAENFGAAARDAGVKRIVYLGGLGHSGEQLSEHLRSRHETGEA